MKTNKNLLKILYPNIYSDWDDELNEGKDKNKITIGSSKFLVNWKCNSCGYKWQQKVVNRVKNNTKCFKCENKEKLLKYKYPELFKEIDFEKNLFDTSILLVGSSKKINWKCTKCDYRWLQSIDTRIKLKTECFVCKNNDNLLINTNPELTKEWDKIKNINHNINHLLSGSNKNVWWICPNCNYSYKAKVYQRAIKNSKCSKCRVRVKKNVPFLEVKPELKNEWDYKLNFLNPENYSSGSNLKAWWKCLKCNKSYECQIFEKVRNSGCPFCRGLKIDILNSIKNTHPEIIKEWDYDKNNLINLFPENVTKGSIKKANWKCKYGHEWIASIQNRTKKKYTTCPICIGRTAIKENSFGFLKPDLLTEWDYEKNDINPYEIRPGSHKIIYWKCEKEHSWSTPLYSRSSGNFSCPYCSKRYTSKENSIGFLDPKFMEEWDEEKNKKLNPYEISIKSDIKAWWKCKKDNNHVWKTSISHRYHGTNCPYCSNINIILNKYIDKYGLNLNNRIYLYKIIIYNHTECFYKIGITKNTISTRFNRLNQDTGYKIMIIEINMGLLEQIINEEQTIHKKTNKNIDAELKKYKPNIKFGGKSECFILPKEYITYKEILMKNYFDIKIISEIVEIDEILKKNNNVLPNST
jgi:hypothetical protein